MNHIDPVIRKTATSQWIENDRNYCRVFETVKAFLPDAFLDCFLSREGFHDYSIQGFSFFHDHETGYCLDIKIYKNTTRLTIRMYGIKNLQIDIPSLNDCINGTLSWGYCEFDRTETGDLCFSLLCDFQNSIELEFDTLDVSELN